MPRYDYKCPRCGHTEEIKHGIDDCPSRRQTRCPTCSTTRLSIFMEKQLASPRVVVRGGTPRFHRRQDVRHIRKNYVRGGLG